MSIIQLIDQTDFTDPQQIKTLLLELTNKVEKQEKQIINLEAENDYLLAENSLLSQRILQALPHFPWLACGRVPNSRRGSSYSTSCKLTYQK